jgi:hypothetical protein
MPTKECLITDSIVVSIPIDCPEKSQDPHSDNQEAVKIVKCLQWICDPRHSQTYIFYGRAHEVLHAPIDSTRCLVTADGGCQAIVILAPIHEPAQRVCLSYKVNMAISQAIGSAQLTAEFNPTTLLAGNNISPATLADSETGEIRPSPSSDVRLMKTTFRLGFFVLEELYRQAMTTRSDLFGPRSRELIRDGGIHIVRAQWAAYLPTSSVSRFLQLTAILNGQTIAHGNGIIQLATHLGLDFSVYTDPETHEVTGVMLVKRHGKKLVYSIVFYDKRERVAQMRQGKTLTLEEVDAVHSHVRLDITAHSGGIEAIVAAARRRLKNLIKRDPSLFASRWRDDFRNGDVRPTEWWLGCAIFVLSHVSHDRDLTRGSFGNWLIPHILRRILRINAIAGFTSEGFHRLDALNDKVAAAWRAAAHIKTENWAKTLAKEAKCSSATVYARRDKWLVEFGVDIALPYGFYRDILFFGPNSLTKPENRSALLRAVRSGEGSETIRLLDDAARDFDRQRTTVVGVTINSRPRAMSIKVACKKLPAPHGARTAPAQSLRQLAPPDRAAARRRPLLRTDKS